MLSTVLLGLVGSAAVPTPARPAPLSALVARVDIPYQQFTLPNGLRVLVHTDRKAPVVAVSVWYHVGSKDEPAGKLGFAHLFEHLMFNGSENSPSDFFNPLQQIGGTDANGTTSFDRTNYFETVPTGALDRVLWLESDRMGHLLGGIDQAKLDTQRAVVTNEKRQGDNEPFGTVNYVVYNTLFPPGHPYHHEPLGSIADLNAATLVTVKDWFRAKYGPDNAVIVLAGDIDLATARTKMARWFGPIPRGPAVVRTRSSIPTLPAPVTTVLRDSVPYASVARYWVVEGVNGKDAAALRAATGVLGGLSSSRLDNALVRGEKIAVNTSASVDPYEDVGILSVSADVKPGGDAVAVGKRLDAIVAEFLAKGPTADEVRRVATRAVSNTIGGYESVGGFGGKAVALAEGLVYSNDPAKYKTDLRDLAALTPARVMAAARKWMQRPPLNIVVEPGTRDTSPAMQAITGDTPSPIAAPVADPAPGAKGAPRPAPPVGTLTALDFPAIERTTLSNGIPVFFARRAAVPLVQVSVSFDAGFASDPKSALGTQSLMLALIDEGTATRSSTQIAEESERLGARISSGASLDRSSISMFALSPNLGLSLGLLADVVRNPVFATGEVERLRGQQLARIKAQLSSPDGIANYVLPGLLYGRGHPYGVPATGTGEASAVATITRDAIAKFHADWIRPDNAQIFVIGDTTLDVLKTQLEASFGTWAAPVAPKPVKHFDVAIPKAANTVYLIDRPGSAQSVILGGLVLDKTGKDDVVTLRQANDVLGGNFLSRLNTDLRETKGWSYGVGTSVSASEQRLSFSIQAPVQTDRTGDSLNALIADTRDYLGGKGTTADEVVLTTNGSIRGLPGDFETSGAVLAAMQRIIWLGRPDDFYERLPARYSAMTAADFDAAARAAIRPDQMTWVVVGDAKSVRPQLENVGLPVVTLPSPAN